MKTMMHRVRGASFPGKAWKVVELECTDRSAVVKLSIKEYQGRSAFLWMGIDDLRELRDAVQEIVDGFRVLGDIEKVRHLIDGGD